MFKKYKGFGWEAMCLSGRIKRWNKRTMDGAWGILTVDHLPGCLQAAEVSKEIA